MGKKEELKEYMVTAEGTISFHTIVMATCEADARERALERDITSLSHSADIESADAAWVGSGEYDCDISHENIVEVQCSE